MLSGGLKSFWALLLLMLSGIVIGGFIGEYLGAIKYMGWLNYGEVFGLKSPLMLDLGVLTLQLGFTLKFTICGIIGLLLGILAYRLWVN